MSETKFEKSNFKIVITDPDGDESPYAVNGTVSASAGNAGAENHAALPASETLAGLGVYFPKTSADAPAIEMDEEFAQAKLEQSPAPVSKNQPAQSGQSSPPPGRYFQLQPRIRDVGIDYRPEVIMERGEETRTYYVDMSDELNIQRYSDYANINPYTDKPLEDGEKPYFFNPGVNDIYPPYETFLRNEGYGASSPKRSSVAEPDSDSLKTDAAPEKGRANTDEASGDEDTGSAAIIAGTDTKSSGKRPDEASAVSAGAAAVNTAPDAPPLSVPHANTADHDAEISASIVNLRPQKESAHNPYKELDWIDRHHLWLSRRGKFLGALSWLTGVGTYRNYKAHQRYGWSGQFNKSFAQTPTPDGPDKSTGLFYQEQEVNSSKSFLHAASAFAGENRFTNLSAGNAFAKKIETLIPVEIGIELESEFGFKIDGDYIDCDYIRQGSKDSVARAETTSPEQAFNELYNDLTERALTQVKRWIESPETDRVMVGITRRRRFRSDTTEWLTLRRHQPAGKDNGAGREWTLLDSKRFVMDAKKNKQPVVASPIDFITSLAHGSNVKEIRIVTGKSSVKTENWPAEE